MGVVVENDISLSEDAIKGQTFKQLWNITRFILEERPILHIKIKTRH
jgi:hypothetical protein